MTYQHLWVIPELDHAGHDANQGVGAEDNGFVSWEIGDVKTDKHWTGSEGDLKEQGVVGEHLVVKEAVGDDHVDGGVVGDEAPDADVHAGIAEHGEDFGVGILDEERSKVLRQPDSMDGNGERGSRKRRHLKTTAPAIQAAITPISCMEIL